MKNILYYLILFLSLSVFLQSCRRSERNRMREAVTVETEEENSKLGSDGWSIEEIKCANTANNVGYLSAEEQKVILICNLARLDGEKFMKTYAKPYLGDSSNEYIESLYSDLKKVKKLQMMVPDNKLYEAAAYHAKDMGATGKIGHTSSDGSSMQTRINRWYSNYKYIGECCDYGYDKALDIVMHLLVDEGVESLGHRKNILDPQFGKIGVSIQPHRVYRYNCVQDFAN